MKQGWEIRGVLIICSVWSSELMKKIQLVVIFFWVMPPWELMLLYYKFKSVRTLFRIIYLAHIKSYLVIMCPNSYAKLVKRKIRSKSSRFRHYSKSLIWPIWSHIWSLFVPIHMQSWSNVKLGQNQVGSDIAQNHSPGLYEVISGNYLP